MKTNGSNYTLRFGNHVGLTHIGMFENGIIWNRNVANWKTLRNFFQRGTCNVAYVKCTKVKKVKGKGRVLAIALLTRELVTRSALQSRKWQLIGMS